MLCLEGMLVQFITVVMVYTLLTLYLHFDFHSPHLPSLSLSPPLSPPPLSLLPLSLSSPLSLPAYSAVLCSAGGSHPARSLPKHSTQRPQDTEHHAQPQEDGAQNGRLWNLQSPLLQNHLCTNSMETLISVTSFPGHMPGVWD